jgi:hypothetical protein
MKSNECTYDDRVTLPGINVHTINVKRLMRNTIHLLNEWINCQFLIERVNGAWGTYDDRKPVVFDREGIRPDSRCIDHTEPIPMAVRNVNDCTIDQGAVDIASLSIDEGRVWDADKIGEFE